MLAPTLTATASWPIAGDAPDLLQIATDQAEVIASQEALLHAYQANLNAVQQPPSGPAVTGTAGIVTAATSIPITGTTGTIMNGSVVTGTANTTAPTILGQVSGTMGRDGTWLFSAPVTLSVATLLTFTPPAGVSTWPVPQDAPTLDLIVQTQTAVLRTQTALIQHYQDLLNNSQVAAPPTGP